MASMIETRNLTKRFGLITAVDDVTLSVEAGEVLGFLGPNGAGKSTAMKMVTGFLEPTSGTRFSMTRSPSSARWDTCPKARRPTAT